MKAELEFRLFGGVLRQGGIAQLLPQPVRTGMAKPTESRRGKNAVGIHLDSFGLFGLFWIHLDYLGYIFPPLGKRRVSL